MTATVDLDLHLHPDDAAPLWRMPEILGAGERGRPVAVHIIWHDTPDASLAAAGLALAERREGRITRWRLERTMPGVDDFWPPGAPSPIVAEAAAPDALGQVLPGPLVPIAGFEGKTRVINGGAIHVNVLSGELRTMARTQPVCRVGFAGPAEAISPLVQAVAQALRLAVPPCALAAEAIANARPPLRPRRQGAPALPADLTVGDAFAHIAAHLADVILYYAPRARDGEAPEPVHQMRVAVRRLRSALSLFGKAIACPEVEAATASVKALNAVLGPARDWDVFCAGTAADVSAAFADDAAVARMVRLAQRRRDAAYAALGAHLDGPEFRQLGLNLAMLAAVRPWAVAEEASDLRHFAAKALGKRHGVLAAHGEDVAALPTEQLHEIRIEAKRMRYAAEFFAPVFPGGATKRFVRRLAALQEQLGLLNDGAVAANLLAQIGQDGRHAGGIVRGFVAARSTDARAAIARSWRKFHRCDVFWE